MPSEVIDQRRLPSLYVPSVSSSFLSEEIRYPAQRQVGFWKSELESDNDNNIGSDRMALLSAKTISSWPMEKFYSVSINSAQNLETYQKQFIQEPKPKLHFEHPISADKTAGFSMASWKDGIHGLGQQAMFLHPGSLNVKENKIDQNELPYENESSLFSSSLPGIHNKNLVDSNLEKDDPFESMKEMEAQTIGNLLPDEDDLFSGVINDVEVEHVSLRNNNNDDADDDLFYNGGGLELGTIGVPNGHRAADMDSLFGGEFIYSTNPSRTLFVNYNESLNDADLRALFETYGDIHMLYTSCKYHGFVIVRYYDLRSAFNAMRELQNKSLIHRKLDLHFVVSKDNLSDKNINQETLLVSGLNSSVSKDYLREIFGVYGEIKEIHEIPQKCQFKFIEFYDIRASEAALHALNGIIILGKRIQLHLSHLGLAACLMQQMSYVLEQEETGLCHKKGSPPNSSPSLCYGGMPFRATTSDGQHSVSQGSIGFPPYLTSPVKVASVGRLSNQPRIDDLNKSMGELNIGLQQMPTFHPHSFPDHRDSLVNSIPYHSSNTISSMALNFAGHTDGVDSTMHTPGLNSAGLSCQSFVNNEEAFGASGNSNCLPNGHQNIWNNPSSHHHRPPGSLMWPNSPSSTNNIGTHPPQLHGIPRVHSKILNGVLPFHRHHVGSAPTCNLSILDRHHVYNGDLTNGTVFHPGCLGTMGFSSSSTQHPLEYVSSNMTQVGRQCNVTSISSPSVGSPSPQPKYRSFHGGRNSMIPMPITFDSLVDRTRGRKKDTSSNHTDSKKQYELDIDRIIRREDGRTTLMIKNIPNKYTSKMLLATIDENHRGTYDFIYLPIDFKNKCNVGYAFINLIDPQQIIPYYKSFNSKKWEKFNSEKVASLAYARIQGKTALIAHFQNSSLLNEDKRCRPILFHSDGPNAGDQEAFPLGMVIRSPRGRGQNSEDSHHGSPSNSTSSGSTKDT